MRRYTYHNIFQRFDTALYISDLSPVPNIPVLY